VVDEHQPGLDNFAHLGGRVTEDDTHIGGAHAHAGEVGRLAEEGGVEGSKGYFDPSEPTEQDLAGFEGALSHSEDGHGGVAGEGPAGGGEGEGDGLVYVEQGGGAEPVHASVEADRHLQWWVILVRSERGRMKGESRQKTNEYEAQRTNNPDRDIQLSNLTINK
jgi:hypothetical protein